MTVRRESRQSASARTVCGGPTRKLGATEAYPLRYVAGSAERGRTEMACYADSQQDGS